MTHLNPGGSNASLVTAWYVFFYNLLFKLYIFVISSFFIILCWKQEIILGYKKNTPE